VPSFGIRPLAYIDTLTSKSCRSSAFGALAPPGDDSGPEAAVQVDRRSTGGPQMIFPCYDGFATLISTSVMAEAESYFALAQEVLRPKHGPNSETLGVLPFSD
jgi:hypothetical protein